MYVVFVRTRGLSQCGQGGRGSIFREFVRSASNQKACKWSTLVVWWYPTPSRGYDSSKEYANVAFCQRINNEYFVSGLEASKPKF